MSKLVTLDCYGTLIDTTRLYGSVGDIGKKIGVDETLLTNLFVNYEDRLMYGESFVRYDVLVYRALEYCEFELNRSDILCEYDSVMAAHEELKPYPEVIDTLEKIKAGGSKIAIMSNSVNDIMRHHLRELKVAFDHVILAEQTHCYKPDLDFFFQSQEITGLSRSEHCHVAAGYWWDIVPASKMGWNKIWVNRKGKRGGLSAQPYHTVTTLDGVLAHL